MTHGSSHQTVEAESTAAWWERIVDRTTKYGERAGDALMYSSAYLAVIAAVELAIVMMLLGIEANPAPVVVAFVTFAVYAYDRLVDVESDEVSNPRQAAFVRRHRDVLYLMASVCYGLAVALSVLGGPYALGITLLPGMFGVLYASDWMPDVGVRFARFKEILVVNTAVVAFAWAVTLTFLPLAFAGRAFTPAAGVVFCYFFLRSFVDTELPNVGDVESDRASDVSTLPLVLGVRGTRYALYGLDLVSLALVVYAAGTGLLPSGVATALGVGIAYSSSVVSRIGRTEDYELLTLASECEYLLVGATLATVVLV
ncbi:MULTISPECIES: UbiA family prenyltransferase [Haloprofundus]|uniref:UbiA family prenyltransferase n=1 Tax=Haloprofundus TaxID=1911573 RepID=UPI000E439F15|nr:MULTISPECIES: UbiA family prenyltransferase [Haloprofundus]QCJ46671.1 4-hydroxybenzoate polyprenyltransferase [Haloprofundus sp. MHR1]